MEKEFDLSKNIFGKDYLCAGRAKEGIIEVKYVKEFIRLLKEGNKSRKTDFLIDKLAGEELI